MFEAFFDIIPYPDHSDHGHTLKAVANEDPPYTRYLLQHQDLIIEYLACPNTVIFEVAYWSRAARKRYQFTPFDPEQSMENYF